MRDIGRHFCPDGELGGGGDPAADFLEDVGVLAHGGAHLALGEAVGAGEVELEGVHADGFAALDEFDPGVFVILFHDGGDESAGGLGVFAAFELVFPDLERAVADELDIFPADDLAARGEELGVAGGNVDDFRGVEADGLGDDGAPALAERAVDDAEVGAGRAGADNEGVGELQAVDGGG